MITAMQGEVSKDDMIFGAIVVTIFVAFCIVLGYAFTRFKNWRFGRHWGPLLPLITNPKITGDGAALRRVGFPERIEVLLSMPA